MRCMYLHPHWVTPFATCSGWRRWRLSAQGLLAWVGESEGNSCHLLQDLFVLRVESHSGLSVHVEPRAGKATGTRDQSVVITLCRLPVGLRWAVCLHLAHCT